MTNKCLSLFVLTSSGSTSLQNKLTVSSNDLSSTDKMCFPYWTTLWATAWEIYQYFYQLIKLYKKTKVGSFQIETAMHSFSLATSKSQIWWQAMKKKVNPSYFANAYKQSFSFGSGESSMLTYLFSESLLCTGMWHVFCTAHSSTRLQLVLKQNDNDVLSRKALFPPIHPIVTLSLPCYNTLCPHPTLSTTLSGPF